MPSSNQLPVGRIAGLFGIRGELKCDPTSAGRTLFSAGERFHLCLSNGAWEDAEVTAVREHKGRLLIRLQGVLTATDGERYAGATFYADRERIELQSGEYLDVDLVGCMLYDPQGKPLGKVTAVEHYPSSDMLVVNGKLVPMVAAFMQSIDLADKRIVTDLPPGLLDDENADEA